MQRRLALSALLVGLAGAFAVGSCSGEIGSPGGGGEGPGTVAQGPSPTSGGTAPCDALGVCEGDGSTPSSGCVECAVLDDGALAIDGGACRDEYRACFGPEGDCAEGHPGCCDFADCLLACPDDDPGTSADEFLDCVCDNDGVDCLERQTDATCLGKDPVGGERYITWVSCIYLDVCPQACG